MLGMGKDSKKKELQKKDMMKRMKIGNYGTRLLLSQLELADKKGDKLYYECLKDECRKRGLG